MQPNKILVHGHFTAGASPTNFEILFIQAGEANGWTFDEQVLTDSVALWESCNVFVDHSLWGHSVRDLGGVLSNVGFNREYNGLTATLKPCGPSAEIVFEAARTMLDAEPYPDLGFSADVIFTADAQNNVQKIMQPLSVDLVIDPAFATKFIRQLNSKGVHPMPEPVVTKPVQPLPAADDLAAMQDVRLAMNNMLLESALSSSQLPDPAQKTIRTAFENKLFKPAELSEAINAWKTTLAAATAKDEIAGPGRVSSMFDSNDQLAIAVDDLVGAPRDEKNASLKVAQFSGVKEAYVKMTGDADMRGGVFPDRIQFQHTTASFPALVASALNKALVGEWAKLGRAGYDWWTKIATVEHFNSINDITWMLFGTVQSLPTVAEGADYTELTLGDGYETASFTKKGGYIGLTLEALDRDDTRKLRAIPRELANAGLREISSTIAALFTTASGAGPTMVDTGALFNAVAVTTKGGHANFKTAALGTDFTAWDAAALAMYNQPMLVKNDTGYYGTGKKMAIEPKYCLVPRDLKAQAEALFIPRWAPVVEAIATKGGPSFAGYVEPITVPEWTDATDWCAVADPAVMPGVMIGERFGLVPQIFLAGSESDPAMFANDESRIKVRHFLAVGVADFRPFVKTVNP